MAGLLLAGCTDPTANAESAQPPTAAPATQPTAGSTDTDAAEKVVKSDDDWRKTLSPAQFRILREKGTERAFSGELNKQYGEGLYGCAGCGAELFTSDTKYDSGCGWPSFYKSVRDGAITYTEDRTHGMVRTEITCTRCGGHLGHVFDDGPPPTGKRYCVNSLSMTFEPGKK